MGSSKGWSPVGIGTNIRRLRESKGWTQKKLADRAGINQSHLSQIEQEVIELPHLKTLREILEALNINHERLMKQLLRDADPETILEYCSRDLGTPSRDA